ETRRERGSREDGPQTFCVAAAMISIELDLQYSDREHRSACAVLLEGDDPRWWLEVLTRQNLQPAVELFPLPVSRNDLRVRGVVVRYRKSETIPCSIPGPRYGIVSDTLLVPTNAVFSPAIEESEWRTLFPDSRRTSVWHPQIGLIAFEPHEIL